MKYLITVASAATMLVLTGCATSSKVQEMIDTSHQDYLSKSEQYESSIAVLKKTASAVLAQNRAQEKKLAELRKELEEAFETIEVLQGNAEAAKVMSAVNTVKVADLEVSSSDAQEALAMNIARMITIDDVYRTVMLEHFQQIADNANAAITDLKIGLEPPSRRAAKKPANFGESIEIVAPDTTVEK
jgi:hypothetical protein